MRLFYLFDSKNEGVEMIPERKYRDKEINGFGEATLEQFLVDHPEVIPSEDMDSDDPPRFLVIKNQAGVTVGSMDILLIDHNGVPTVIEAKLVDNREIRRSVLAQGIEYLACLQSEWTADRIIEEGQEFRENLNVDFQTEFEKRLGISLDEEFLQKMSANLANNRMRLIVASDEIPSQLLKVIEFMNETSVFDVYGLEIRLFASGGKKILAPKLLGQSERVRERKSTRVYSKWNEERFFAALGEDVPDVVKITRDLMSFGVKVSGRQVEWGSGKESGSFTARLIVNGKRFSLFSVYTYGKFSINIGWNYEKLEELNPNLSEDYRVRAIKELAVDFERRGWESWHLLPTAELSSLLPDNAKAFKKIITDFVAEVKKLLGET